MPTKPMMSVLYNSLVFRLGKHELNSSLFALLLLLLNFEAHLTWPVRDGRFIQLKKAASCIAAACFLRLGELVCPQLDHTCEPWCIAAACFLCLGELVCPPSEHTCEPWCLAAACFLCLGELVCPPLEHTCEPWCIAAACFLRLGELVCPQLDHTCEPWCIAAACFLCLGELVCPPLEHTCEPQSFAAQPPIDPDCSVLCPSWPVMVVVSESVHPRGLDFQNQRKVVILRDVHGLTFPEIAKQVKTLFGGRPSLQELRAEVDSWCAALPLAEAETATEDWSLHLCHFATRSCPSASTCTPRAASGCHVHRKGNILLHKCGHELPLPSKFWLSVQPACGKNYLCNGWMRVDHSPSRAHWSVEFLEDIPVTHVAAQERALSATASWTRHVQQAMRPWPVHSSVGRAQSRWLCYGAVPSTEKALHKWMGGCCQGRKASRCD